MDKIGLFIDGKFMAECKPVTLPYSSMDVSVILFYNVNRGFLDKAIKSYHDQVFTGTSELVIIHADRSISENLNEGIRQAKGKWIKILAEDDQLLPNCLQDLFDKAEEGYDVIFANAENQKEDGTIEVQRSFIGMTVGQMAEDYGLHGGTGLYRREMLEAVGGFDETLLFAEEFDLHMRLALNGYKFGYLDKSIYRYRIHSHQKSMQGGYSDSEAYIARYRYVANLRSKYLQCDKIVK